MLEKASKTICVPEASLVYEGDSTFVYLLTDSTSTPQQFKRTPVTTGISDGIHIEVKKGLKVGNKVRGIEKIDDTNDK